MNNSFSPDYRVYMAARSLNHGSQSDQINTTADRQTDPWRSQPRDAKEHRTCPMMTVVCLLSSQGGLAELGRRMFCANKVHHSVTVLGKGLGLPPRLCIVCPEREKPVNMILHTSRDRQDSVQSPHLRFCFVILG